MMVITRSLSSRGGGARSASPRERRTRIHTTAILSKFGGKKNGRGQIKRETVIPEPSYAIPATLLGGAALSHIAFSNDGLAGVFGVLGAFLAFQASRVKFVFEDDALEVVVGEKQVETQNKFVGGKNRWTYDSFVNWEFWWPGFPVLVYFKETQTRPEGQIHFFPLIFNGKQVYDVMVERCGPSMGSGPTTGGDA